MWFGIHCDIFPMSGHYLFPATTQQALSQLIGISGLLSSSNLEMEVLLVASAQKLGWSTRHPYCYWYQNCIMPPGNKGSNNGKLSLCTLLACLYVRHPRSHLLLAGQAR